MRLAGQAKAGFYPAAPEAVDVALARLKLADPTALTPILDPCAGTGDALFRLANGLGVAPECVYAIELDEGRGLELQSQLTVDASMPTASVLAPCSFEGARITHGSFSFIWCNPPYDDEVGGGRRCEYSFLQRSTALLRPHGIIALVVPERIATEDKDVTRQLALWFEHLTLIPFPESVQKYDEVIVLGERRRQHAKDDELTQKYYHGPTEIAWTDQSVYVIPPGDRPLHFEKIEYTPAELVRDMGKSPLRRLLQPPAARKLPSPPLALGTGHIALLLAAGHLDGVVRPEGEPPHVVRGTASKVKYLAAEGERENDNGSVTSIQKWNEKIVLTVRAVDTTGEIHTFTQE